MPEDCCPSPDQIRENLAHVRARVAAAAVRSGRLADNVKLIGVTKYVSTDVARLLADAGLHDLAESRPQSLWQKAEALADLAIRWHLIGHLQRNKVKRTLPLTACVHSADSLRLLEEINREAIALGRAADVLLEVNISGDAAKTGFRPEELERQLPTLGELQDVRILGLMGMAALEGGSDRARHDFAALRDLRDKLAANCPPQIVLRELSMGMSGDYEVAIEEGATMVRVGSALFAGVAGEA